MTEDGASSSVRLNNQLASSLLALQLIVQINYIRVKSARLTSTPTYKYNSDI